jgi:hypothetical protein
MAILYPGVGIEKRFYRKYQQSNQGTSMEKSLYLLNSDGTRTWVHVYSFHKKQKSMYADVG